MTAPSAQPRFDVGQLVRHRRYGYRGVIFGVDPTCQADDDWYQSNPTQPSRDQPWYRVLVHGARHTTYVAQSNLTLDPDPAPVEHPLIDHLFGTFFGGRYHRENLN